MINQVLFHSILSEVVTSMFKVGTGGCGSRSASPLFPGRAGLCGFFSTIQTNHHLKHNYQHHQFPLYKNSINFLIS